jgi:transposase, IS30 family
MGGGDLYKELRHHGKKYNKRSKKSAGRGCIPNRIDIDQRPLILEKKARLGDWELDTIIGAKHVGAIVSMVERRSKLTKLVKISHKTADNVEKALLKG